MVTSAMSTKSGFDQSRKAVATKHKQTIRTLLEQRHDTVCNVERPQNGEYTGEIDAMQLLDYSGIDWLAKGANGLVPIAERIKRNGKRDFSLRVENGRTDHNCERETIPNAIAHNNIYPVEYCMVITSNGEIELAYIVDVERAIQKIQAGKIDTTRATFDDGTVSEFYDYADLVLHECVLEVLT